MEYGAHTMNFADQKLILIVDDSVDNCALLKMLLEAKGFKTLTAKNGRDALALLVELTQLPDLIFLDAQMPVMNGFEFRVEQEKNSRLREIPVVVMSADSSESMFERMNHPLDVLIKPLRSETVLERAISIAH